MRIAMAEDISGIQIEDVQTTIALLQVVDPITEQFAATMKSLAFYNFYTRVTNSDYSSVVVDVVWSRVV